MRGKTPRTRAPKLRAWGKTARKVMTMTIPTEKDKLLRREHRQKLLRKELKNASSH